MKTLKQINRNLKKYVIAHNYTYGGGDYNYQDTDFSVVMEKESFLASLNRVKLPFVTITEERSIVDLYTIKSLAKFAFENKINLQLYLEDSCYKDIELELLEFTKPYSHKLCNEIEVLFNYYIHHLNNNDVIIKDEVIINNPLLDLQDLLYLIGFCKVHGFDMNIYSMGNEEEEDEEKNNRVKIKFIKKIKI